MEFDTKCTVRFTHHHRRRRCRRHHLGSVALTPHKFNLYLQSFRVTHYYAILNVIFYAFYELKGVNWAFFLISFLKRT